MGSWKLREASLCAFLRPPGVGASFFSASSRRPSNSSTRRVNFADLGRLLPVIRRLRSLAGGCCSFPPFCLPRARP